MDTYLLTVCVFIFLGLLAVIALLERQRRMHIEHLQQIKQEFSASQANVAAQASAFAAALLSLQKALETAAFAAANSLGGATETTARSVSAEIASTLKEVTKRLELGLERQQKVSYEVADLLVGKLADFQKSVTKEIVQASEKSTSTVEALKNSLEESVRF